MSAEKVTRPKGQRFLERRIVWPRTTIPSSPRIVVLISIRAMAAFLVIGPVFAMGYMVERFGLGPWVITFPIFSVAGIAAWIIQNLIDDREGLVWRPRIFRIGIRKNERN
jgi:hypothetical protein